MIINSVGKICVYLCYFVSNCAVLCSICTFSRHVTYYQLVHILQYCNTILRTTSTGRRPLQQICRLRPTRHILYRNLLTSIRTPHVSQNADYGTQATYSHNGHTINSYKYKYQADACCTRTSLVQKYSNFKIAIGS